MTEEIKIETNTEAPKPENVITESSPETKEAKTFTQAELDKIIAERLERESKKRKDAEAKVREEAERDTLAKNQEWEKLAKKHESDLLEAQQRLKELELNELRTKAAAKYQLPLEIAERLRGETLEELEKDAEGLKALIPQAKSQGKLNPTVPGGDGQPVKETREQKLQRLGLG
jgi:hypothetical protein